MPAAPPSGPASGRPCTRHKFVHIHQSIITASNSNQVYCILNNWCIWIYILAVETLPAGLPAVCSACASAAACCYHYHYYHHVMCIIIHIIMIIIITIIIIIVIIAMMMRIAITIGTRPLPRRPRRRPPRPPRRARPGASSSDLGARRPPA